MMNKDFQYVVEQFADIRILRYRIPGFDELPLPKKLYLYYLSEAALCGRDILWDQNNQDNLALRKNLELIYHVLQAKNVTGEAFRQLETLLKRVWFSNGFHHHYSTDKLKPAFTANDLKGWLALLSEEQLTSLGYHRSDELFQWLYKVLFDPNYAAKRVSQEMDVDLVNASANNFYEDVTQSEVEEYYKGLQKEGDKAPISAGLNSKLVKENDQLVEKVWRVGGLYGAAIEKIVGWLRKAQQVAENEEQKQIIELLCRYYATGDLKLFDDYNIAWLKEQAGDIDFVNGFIEIYGDSLGIKATWESLVNIKDAAETQKAAVISEQAQWFEDRSPVDEQYRKKKVTGVSMKVINAVMLGGDCYPATPIGINLPNPEWIREQYGSKSVTLDNITHAYHQASLTSGVIEEFAYDEAEIQLHKTYGAIADNLHTHLHECLGHGSGIMLPGVKQEDLKAYGSVIEETRADLYGLYFMGDEKMLELGLVPHMDVAKAQYNSYIRNGLMVQLARVEPGKNIEQAHMRNRQLISQWVYEHGKENHAITMYQQGGKTYYVVNDHDALRQLFAKLLKEVQRIKSTGDMEAAKKLVETYGVQVEHKLHAEVLERYKKLKVAPYSGFINPVLQAVTNTNGDITDVEVDYSESYHDQMVRYGKCYSFL
ncbi:MAG: dihydrofolate reductase [Marinilabiliaceae bacterium]|nr:dihydrofolate reductase [Marinilabiliaceae bacterium]